MNKFNLICWRRTLLGALLISGATGFLGQQQSQPPVHQRLETDVSVIRKNVRRVVLDVVVTGKNGEPVRGLSKNDFKVVEDGKPQAIKSFDVHDFDNTSEFISPEV